MGSKDTHTIRNVQKNLFPIVGIGASAGGLESFRKFIKAVPQNSGMAFILVQHLHPEHSSNLQAILQRETSIPVHEIGDNIKVEAGNIYIIPPNKNLVATDSKLRLSRRPPRAQRNLPIDILFLSLAEVYQSHAIGIVLSGTGSDGTLGLKSIKDHGGITFAEDIGSAAYDGMPQSAINAEVVDFILAPENMPQQLMDLIRTLKILPSKDETVPEQLTDEQNFRQIISLLRVRSGVDFTYYKQTTIRRRILRRMVIVKQDKVYDYLEYLKQNKPEIDNLFQDMLIPVSSFFRDPKVFESLCNKVFANLLKDKSNSNPLRIWVAGCAMGQEAYSMAICLYEFLTDKITNVKVQIFATDLSERTIAAARLGLYRKNDLEGVSESRLHQFFTKIDGQYQIKKTIRDMCVFACHNFIKDPPFARMDLISCRNTLIYMEPFLQKKAFSTFNYSLNEKGYLLLGKSETTGASSDLFVQVDKKEKLYIRKTGAARYMNVTGAIREESIKDKDYGLRSNERKRDDFQQSADEVILSKYAPAGVIVNERFDIVQFRGSTRDYLEPASGKVTLSVLKMAREGLSFEIRNALHQAKLENEVVIKEGIPIADGNKLVTIEVIPLMSAVDLHFLILFRETGIVNNLPLTNNREPQIDETGDANIVRIRQLEKDLFRARDDMRSITEDQEAVNEELQSANEELLSGGEELQSLNEELETSKEELQSTNEELITVNQELVDRNEQFNQARVYAETIVGTMHEPLLVLSQDFKIKSANNSFCKMFQITEEGAIGRILFDLEGKTWDIPGLRSQLLKIQKGDQKFIEWETTYAFPVAGVRTIVFNAQPIQRENNVNWMLLAFNDITAIREREKAELANTERLQKILENIPQITFTTSVEGTTTYFNKVFLDYMGVTFEKALSCEWFLYVHPEMIEIARKMWKYSVETGDDFNMELQIKRKGDDLFLWHLFRISAVRNGEGVITSWVGTATDIHNQKTKEQEKDVFISIASHELKTPLTAAKAYIQLLSLKMKNSGDENLLYLKKAGNSIERLNVLITELLDVNKLQHGKLHLNISEFNLDDMLSSAIDSIHYTSPSHSIIKSGEVEGLVSADKDRLQQVVINLLTNAVKYSPRSNQIFLNVEKENNEIKVSIRDNGIGIRKENLDRIFERYYREDGRTVHFQGLGIGLSICSEIIRLHNGRIWADSELDKGSTFYFTIPQ